MLLLLTSFACTVLSARALLLAHTISDRFSHFIIFASLLLGVCCVCCALTDCTTVYTMDQSVTQGLLPLQSAQGEEVWRVAAVYFLFCFPAKVFCLYCFWLVFGRPIKTILRELRAIRSCMSVCSVPPRRPWQGRKIGANLNCVIRSV